jgi:hypothetical protein
MPTNDDGCECSEEYGPCEQHGTVLAQYDGASTRTADELTYIYVEECFAILDQQPTPVAADILRRVDEDWAAQQDTYGVNWISDPDLADELRDLAWQLESTIGAWTYWDDGFVIVEPTNDCPLND